MSCSVLVIDDHPIVLRGCRLILECAGVERVLEAPDLVSGYRLYLRHKPDVLIVDLAIGNGRLGGLSFIRKVRSRDPVTPILVFSMHNDPRIIADSLEAGATGYVLKDAAATELVGALETIFHGKPYLARDLAVEVALSHRRRFALSTLTPRELQTLNLLSEGKPYTRIAAELDISYKTVVNICYQLRQKLGVDTLPELIRRATELISGAS
jgi:two-component system, NarL family, invasion response regulator UvrY